MKRMIMRCAANESKELLTTAQRAGYRVSLVPFCEDNIYPAHVLSQDIFVEGFETFEDIGDFAEMLALKQRRRTLALYETVSYQERNTMFFLLYGNYGEHRSLEDAKRFEQLDEAKAAIGDSTFAVIVETDKLEWAQILEWALCYFYTKKRGWFRFADLNREQQSHAKHRFYSVWEIADWDTDE